MASFSYYTRLDLPVSSFNQDWVLSSMSATRVAIESGDFKVVLAGSGFSYNGTSFSGTLTSFKAYAMDTSAGVLVERLVMANTEPLAGTSLQSYADHLFSPYASFEPAGMDFLLTGDDTITGSAGNDQLSGYGGNDRLVGAGGDDLLLGDGYAYGPDDGAGGHDTLIGGNGNDVLDGGYNADTMVGGAGNDGYSVDNPGDVVTELAGGGLHDHVQLSVRPHVPSTAGGSASASDFTSYTLAANVEDLDVNYLSYSTASIFTMRGNDAGNKISATFQGGASTGGFAVYGLGGNDRISCGVRSSSNDTLDGGTGADTMLGGAGSDTYCVDNLGDVVTESVYSPPSTTPFPYGDAVETDTVVIQLQGKATLSLGGTVTGLAATKTFSGIENLTLGRAATTNALNGIGGASANLITGNAGANALHGLGGNDTLVGGAGADTLVGGTGADMLTGGTGNDRFVFTSIADTGMGAARDTITDFAAGDVLDLLGIDADVTLGGDQAFTFIGGAAFSTTDATGQLRYAGGVFYGSNDADALAEFEIAVSGPGFMGKGYFLL